MPATKKKTQDVVEKTAPKPKRGPTAREQADAHALALLTALGDAKIRMDMAPRNAFNQSTDDYAIGNYHAQLAAVEALAVERAASS